MSEPWTLVLLRHATAEPARPGAADRDRPLSPAGRAEAAGVGTHLRAAGLRIDLVLCSPALRTRQTLDGLELVGVPVELVPELYDATTSELLELLNLVEPDVVGGPVTVLVVGHAPAVPGAVQVLADPSTSSGTALRALVHGFPPATLARLSCGGSSGHLSPAALLGVRVAAGPDGISWAD